MDKQNKTLTKSSTERPTTVIKTKTTLTQNPITNNSKQSLPLRSISKANTESKPSLPNKSNINVHTSSLIPTVTGTQSKSNTIAENNAHIDLKSTTKSSGTLLAKTTVSKSSPLKNLHVNKTASSLSSDNTLMYKFPEKSVTNKPLEKPADIFVLDSIINPGQTDLTVENVLPDLIDLEDEDPFIKRSTAVLTKKTSEEKNAQGYTMAKASSDAMNVYIKEITSKVVKADENQEKEHEENVFYKNALNTSGEHKDNEYKTFSIEPSSKWNSAKIKELVEDETSDDKASSEDDVKIQDDYKSRSQIEESKKIEIGYKIGEKETNEVDSIHDNVVKSLENPATASSTIESLLNANKTEDGISSKNQTDSTVGGSKKRTKKFISFLSRVFGKKSSTSDTERTGHIKIHKARTSKHITPSTLTKISEASDNARTGEESASSVTSADNAMKRTLNPGAHDSVNVEVETTAVVGDAPITQTESKGEASLAL